MTIKVLAIANAALSLAHAWDGNYLIAALAFVIAVQLFMIRRAA